MTDNLTPTIPTSASTTATVSVLSTQTGIMPTLSPERASYENGVMLYNQKKYPKAIEAFNTTISLNKTNGEAYFARGKAFYQIGRKKIYEFRGDEDFNQAVSDFESSLNYGLNSNNTVELFTLRGYSNYWIGYLQLQKHCLIGKYSFDYFNSAAGDFSQVLEDNPDDVDALIGRSLANGMVGQGSSEVKYPYDPQKAELSGKDAKRATELAPHNGWARYALGGYLGDVEKLSTEELIKRSDETINSNPEEAWFWVQRGWMKYHLRDYDGARNDYAKALELQPRFAGAYQRLATVEGQDGKKEEALINVQKALEINPNIGLWWLDFGGFQFDFMGQMTISGLEEVLNSYDRAIAIDPENPEFHFRRWQILIYLNRIPEAKEELRIFKNLELSDPEFGSWMENVNSDPFYYGKYIERR
jgi:tetratricopeptide (TPR) repeat protein